MRTVKSFDIFDTLIGRKCFEPDNIFDEVEAISKFKDFKSKRKNAEVQSKDKTFEDIYERFKIITGCSDSKMTEIKNLELELEYKNIFPISANMNAVRDGDILVSDTYFSADMIRSFLKRVGFNKEVEIYTSYSGKSQGAIWPKLRRLYNIESHTGDNYTSDIVNCEKCGIKGVHFNAQFSVIENMIHGFGGNNLSRVIRFLRLFNPYDGNKRAYWHSQTQFNLPILVAASYFLNAICLKKGCNKLLFATRDGTHWQRVYKQLFPEHEVVTFHTSRRMLRAASADYVEYFRSEYNKNSMIVDLFSRGKSYMDFVKKLDMPFNFFTLLTLKSNKLKDGVEYFKITNHFGYGAELEILNYDLVGTMYDYCSKLGPIRLPPEYDTEIIKVGHDCMSLGINLITKDDINYGQILSDLIGQLSKSQTKRFLIHNISQVIKLL